MMKVKTHYFYTIGFALLTVPVWASLWIAYKHLGALDQFRPWLILTARDELPIDLWEFAVQAGFVGALVTGSLLFYLADGMVFGVESSDVHGTARWARRSEIQEGALMENWGVTLGKLGKPKSRGSFLRTNSVNRSNILVSAPPRSGKGAGIIIPTLLDYPGSVVVYDVKGENYEATARMRAKNGDKVLVFSPFDMELENVASEDHSLARVSHSFNPLIEIAAVKDLEDRLTLIQTLASALLSVPATATTEASLLKDGRRIFIAVTAIVCNEDNPTLARVSELLTPSAADLSGDDVPDYKTMFAALAKRAPDPLSRADLLKATAQDNKSLGIYLTVLQGAGLEAWNNPAIIRATSRNDFDFSLLRKEPHSLYLVVPNSHKYVAAPVVRLFFQRAILTLQEKLPGKRFLPVLFMIDEFHSLGRMQAVVDATTILPGYGGRMCLIVQTPSSIAGLYGREQAEVVMDATQVKVWMAPNSETTKLKLSQSLGNETVAVKSVSGKKWGSTDQQSESFSEKGRALMTPEEVGRLDEEQLLVTVQNRYPIRANKVRYWKDRHYGPLFKSQKNLPWPEIPVVKEGTIEIYDDFLRPVGGSIALTNTRVSKVTVDESRAPSEPLDSVSPAGFPDFDEPEEGRQKASYVDSLQNMMKTVQAPSFRESYEDLFEAAPLTEGDSPELIEVARRLSPDEIIAKLSSLFPGPMTS
ncbi:type IV secretory system conjugative DNA transfer family protein [Pelagibius sp. Alg239-R121]|uniref:type IV secretory system conjugative DNA transfer family protein n=1 Tax=Pelagibius sp. Alg239-R121 TaxID=2993448 RepID=UPI0024A71835|nr:type IV secretory system conjugative DNA transfer family protein [Pelagibius sp. Alg239-R121]